MEGTKGVDDTGMEARGGLGERAGRTGAAYMRFSISSISDCAEECSGFGWRDIVAAPMRG